MCFCFFSFYYILFWSFDICLLSTKQILFDSSYASFTVIHLCLNLWVCLSPKLKKCEPYIYHVRPYYYSLSLHCLLQEYQQHQVEFLCILKITLGTSCKICRGVINLFSFCFIKFWIILNLSSHLFGISNFFNALCGPCLCCIWSGILFSFFNRELNVCTVSGDEEKITATLFYLGCQLSLRPPLLPLDSE